MRKILPIILSLILLLTGCSKSQPGATWQEQYDLGVRYLSDGNYEEAIIAFTAAIEIDPKREEAYVGLADVYYATGDTAKAEEILAQMPERGSEDSVVSRTERVDNDDGSYRISEYDASGNWIRDTWYNADGTVDFYLVNEYDASGNLVRRTFYNDDSVCVEDYDISGNYVRRTYTFYNADGMVDSYFVDDFDASGNIVRKTFYNADGTVNNYVTYTYDASGKLERELGHHSSGEPDDYYLIYEYDADGILTGRTMYWDWDGDAVADYESYERAEYDADGNIVGFNAVEE